MQDYFIFFYNFELISSQVKIEECNKCEGHLRLGLLRTTIMSQSEIDYMFTMFLGIKIKKEGHIFRDQYVLSRSERFQNSQNYNQELWDEHLVQGTLVGYVFDRKRGILIVLFNGEKVLRINDVPLENPMEWTPAFSVGPHNQVRLCQELSFDVVKVLEF